MDDNTNDNYFSNENIIDNIDDFQEKVNEIKFGILFVKLSILNEILKSKIKLYLIYFLNKLYLKKHSLRLFKESDNFLTIFPNNKIKDFYKYYAIKRFIYVIKKYKFRYFLLMNSFHLWKIQKNLMPNSMIKSKYSKNLFNLIFVISKIINEKQSLYFKEKTYLLQWLENVKKKQIMINRGIIILQNLINRKISLAFYLFPKNNFYLKYKSNLIKNELDEVLKKVEINDNDIYYKTLLDYNILKKKIEYYKKKTILFKFFEIIDKRNYIDKKLLISFNKMRFNSHSFSSIKKENNNLNEIIINLKCDTLINAALVIKVILDNYIKNTIMLKKRTFFNLVLQKVNLLNTLVEYNHKYKLIPNLINDKNKINFTLVRNKFKKIILLRNIFIIRTKHKYLFSESNICINNSYFQSCFYKWKNIKNDIKTKYQMKLFYLSQIFYILKKNFILNNWNKFLGNMLIVENQKILFQKYSKQLFYILISSINTILFKIFNFFIIRLKIHNNISHIDKNNNEKPSKKEFSYINSVKVYNLYLFYYKKKLKYFFQLWRKNIRITYLRSYKNSNKIIDKKIFQNMTYILLEYEKQDLNLQKELSNIKNLLKKPNILKEIVLKKHYGLIFKYFIIWYKVVNSPSSLYEYYIESEKIKEENNNLINTYYEKKNQYKKIISDYKYLKKHYCDKCIGEDFDIDYKSIKSEEINEMENTETNNLNDDFDSNMMNFSDEEVINENKNVPETFTKTTKTINSVAERENRIKEYQNEYKKLSEEYEETISDLKKKKEELLELKRQFLAKKND